MYCVRCGVKLQEGEARCPLCDTPVWNPEADGNGENREKNYPDTMPRHYRETRRPAAIALTILCALAVAVVLIICFRLNRRLGWGGYVVGGIGLFYVIAVLPCWFLHPRAEVFLPVGHAAAALYVLYICLSVGGRWFLPFAFPVIAASCILSEAMLCLLKYVHRGRAFIFGGFLILLGGYTMLVEFFEHLAFGTGMFRWSLFSLAGFGAAGLFLLVLGMISPFRQSMKKRFFF